MAGPGVSCGITETPVSLVDAYPTILDAVGVQDDDQSVSRPGTSLFGLARTAVDNERTVFSEYHAVAAESGGFMLRKGRWKYHYYVGFQPELFDLDEDPEEISDLASDPAFAPIVNEMHMALLSICDPEHIDKAAKRAQAALVESFGGREAARKVGAPGATPPPGQES